jgi:hypothetical protein
MKVEELATACVEDEPLFIFQQLCFSVPGSRVPRQLSGFTRASSFRQQLCPKWLLKCM